MRSTPTAPFWQLPPSWKRLWQQIEALPPAVPEDSIPLRIAVQSLVVVGIIATVVAANTSGSDILGSLLAIPLSILGAAFSWYRRHQRNITVKFALAAGMLVTLAVFLGNLVESLNDTRVVLAEFLIQIQVLHSFDLPRRKDLGYSIVIGLVLLAVAATLSQTLSFGPLLLIFLAIALPTLVLDYRSRLGLAQPKSEGDRKSQKKTRSLTARSYLLLFVAILAVGFSIFAFIPRFPGYQLRSLPVSSPIDFPGQFDGGGVVNPGYGEQEAGTAGEQLGGSPTTGAGSVDETYYYGFNERINQNLRGSMTSKVVMRVRSQAEGFWRVLAFDRYTGEGWEMTRTDSAITFNRPSWSYRFLLPNMWKVAETREVVQTFTIISDLPNIIPALSLPSEVYFPTLEMSIDPEGGLRSPVSLTEGITYSVLSRVPYRDRTKLATASTEYSDAIRQHYLQIPDSIRARIKAKAEELLARSETPVIAPYEKALYLAQSLKQLYEIRDVPFLEPERDLVEAFLFDWQGGYPDHFSTVLTVMLRSLGIPARLVVGFGAGQYNPLTGMYVVRNTDAYAMTEVFFPEYGWFAFNPIPGFEVLPPSPETEYTWEALRAFWRWVAGWLPSPVTAWVQSVASAIITWALTAIAWFLGLFTKGWMGLFLGLFAAIGITFLLWLGWTQWQYWRHQRWLARLHPMERLYQNMLDLLVTQGCPRHPAQTPLEYAYHMWERQPANRAEAIADISHAYVRWRYGDETPDLPRLQQRLTALRQTQYRNLWQQIRSRMPLRTARST